MWTIILTIIFSLEIIFLIGFLLLEDTSDEKKTENEDDFYTTPED
jgi:hypothetical protein